MIDGVHSVESKGGDKGHKAASPPGRPLNIIDTPSFNSPAEFGCGKRLWLGRKEKYGKRVKATFCGDVVEADWRDPAWPAYDSGLVLCEVCEADPDSDSVWARMLRRISEWFSGLWSERLR